MALKEYKTPEGKIIQVGSMSNRELQEAFSKVSFKIYKHYSRANTLAEVQQMLEDEAVKRKFILKEPDNLENEEQQQFFRNDKRGRDGKRIPVIGSDPP